MDFELTPEQREIQGVTRELAEAEIVPNAVARDQAAVTSVRRTFAALGKPPPK